MKRALTALAACVALATAPGAARADTPPSRWDAARDPAVRDRYALHLKIRELLFLDASVNGRTVQSIALERARGLLEDAGAAHSPDVRLRFDLGEVYEQLHRHEQAIAVLQPAVDAFPDHPAAVDALMTLAYAYAYLDRSKEERETYKRYLARVTDDRSKAIALLNLAEAEMRLGNLEDAVAYYRDTIAVAAQMPNSVSASETSVLAVWGLSVALDRSGDPQAAIAEAKLATEMDAGERLIGHGENVFFVPPYERDWYLGLAEMVHATGGVLRSGRATGEGAPSSRESLDAWTRAVEHWSHYVSSAEATDRWLPLAKSHLARCQAERAAVAARVAKEPPPPAGTDPQLHVIP